MRRRFLIGCVLLLSATSVFSQSRPGEVRYPSQLDDFDSLIRVKDNASTTLTTSVNSAATTITVTSTASFPTTGTLTMGGEICTYIVKTATTFEGLARGVGGTAATSHNAGILVRGSVLAFHKATIDQVLIAIEKKIGHGISPAGHALADTCLRKNVDGTTSWRTCGGGGGEPLIGGGDMLGPEESLTDGLPLFSDETGKNIKAAAFNGIVKLSGNAASAAVAGTDYLTPSSSLNPANFSGLIPSANMGTGTANSSVFLRGDRTWVAITGGGDALVANPLSQFAATTSVQLAENITNETGSGALVFATQPTLSTPIIADTDFDFANHPHTSIDGGGTLNAGLVFGAGTVSLARGGTEASLADPGADRIMFWRDSAGTVTWLTLGTNLSITGTTLDASGGGGGGDVLSTASNTWTTGTQSFVAADLLIPRRAAVPGSPLAAQIYQNTSDEKFYACKDTSTCGEIFVAGQSGPVSIASGGTGNTSIAYVTLTDGATITWTVAGLVNNATVTLEGNRTLAISGATSGMSGTLIVKQDATGSRTITLPAGSKVVDSGAGAITLTTAANAIDILRWTFDGTNYFWTYSKSFT